MIGKILKVFIAGHGGMVGSALKKLAPDAHEIFFADRDVLDLKDKDRTIEFLGDHKVDAIIMAAAKVGGILENSTKQSEFLLDNLAIQDSMFRAGLALEIRNFLFLGSSCIYPRLCPQPISENSLLTGPLEPTNDGYAIAKIAGIRLAQAIYEEKGWNYFSVMPTNLYGPNDNFDLLSSHVPAALMRKFHEAVKFEKNFVEVWGTGEARREFMHVNDLADACWFLLEKRPSGELINVGTGQDMTISTFAEIIAKVASFQGEIRYDRSKPDGTPRKLLNIDKVNHLGWKSKIGLEAGIRATYDWYLTAEKEGIVRGL